MSDALEALYDVAMLAYEEAREVALFPTTYAAGRHIVDALLTDDNFNDIIRAVGGKVVGLDHRMRAEWGSSVLFKQGGDLYE
jgi:hypothetical protein